MWNDVRVDQIISTETFIDLDSGCIIHLAKFIGNSMFVILSGGLQEESEQICQKNCAT